MELITVIVPIYNVSQYLDRCVNSIVNQTYKNLEIILVDDGSRDDSSKKCDEYAIKYKNIVVIHKKNEGLGFARNSGLSIAKGSYIVFVDGDDWIENNAIEALVWLEEENESDIAFIIKAGNEHSTGEVLIGDGKKMILHILEIFCTFLI